MRKGTFSVQRAGTNSSAHNSRKNPPKYLIGLEPGTDNFYQLLKSDEDFILEAQQIYKDKIGQAMQKKQIPNLIQETVLTLKKNQDETDVKKLFEELHKKYGGHELLEVSVHRDEGHFLKDGIAYYPTKNILKKDNDWFIESVPDSKEFDTKININDFERVYNYHAHAKFSMFDREQGKTARMQKKDMSSRIKFVSEKLGLEYAPDKKTSRISKSVNQVKNEHHQKSVTQQELSKSLNNSQKLGLLKDLQLAKIKDVKEQLKAEKEKLKQSREATQADYVALKIIYSDLETKARQKDLTIKELKSELKSVNKGSEKKKALKNEIKELKETIKTQNKSLEGTKRVQDELDHTKTLLSDLKTTNESYLYGYQEIKTELKQEQEKNSKLRDEINGLKSEVTSITKQKSEATKEDYMQDSQYEKSIWKYFPNHNFKSVQNFIERIGEKYNTLKEQVNELLGKNEKLEERVKELSSDKRILESKKNKLESKVEELEKVQSEYESKKDNYSQYDKLIKIYNQESEAQLNSRRNQIKQHHQER